MFFPYHPAPDQLTALNGLALGIGVLVAALLVAITFGIASVKELRLWNAGNCRECRQPWIFFGPSVKGDERGYICHCPQRLIWITFADRKQRRLR